jgi:uncharacterized protein involved in tolerance to divalent cations
MLSVNKVRKLKKVKVQFESPNPLKNFPISSLNNKLKRSSRFKNKWICLLLKYNKLTAIFNRRRRCLISIYSWKNKKRNDKNMLPNWMKNMIIKKNKDSKNFISRTVKHLHRNYQPVPSRIKFLFLWFQLSVDLNKIIILSING